MTEDEFVRKYRPLALRYARQYGSPHLVEDALQEGLIGLLLARRKSEGPPTASYLVKRMVGGILRFTGQESRFRTFSVPAARLPAAGWLYPTEETSPDFLLDLSEETGNYVRGLLGESTGLSGAGVRRSRRQLRNLIVGGNCR